MANWSDLKAAVASIVKTNGNKEITGQLLQNVLNNIISNVGLNSSFAGIATPETNPGTPDGNVFYLATTAGTYSNFNGIVINSGEAAILEWKGSWAKKDSGFATKEKLSKLGLEVEMLNSSFNDVELELNTIDAGSGNNAALSTRFRTKGFLSAPFKVKMKDGYTLNYLYRYDTNGVYVGYLDARGQAKLEVTDKSFIYRLSFRKNDDTNITELDLQSALSYYGKVGMIEDDIEQLKLLDARCIELIKIATTGLPEVQIGQYYYNTNRNVIVKRDGDTSWKDIDEGNVICRYGKTLYYYKDGKLEEVTDEKLKEELTNLIQTRISPLDSYFNSVELELNTISADNGSNQNMSSRFRTKGYVAAPFIINMKSGYTINYIMKYDKYGMYAGYDNIKGQTSIKITDESYIYRLTFRKTGDSEVVESDLASALAFNGKIGMIEQTNLELFNKIGLVEQDISSLTEDVDKPMDIYKEIQSAYLDGQGDIVSMSSFSVRVYSLIGISKIKLQGTGGGVATRYAFYTKEDISSTNAIEIGPQMSGEEFSEIIEVPSNALYIAVTYRDVWEQNVSSVNKQVKQSEKKSIKILCFGNSFTLGSMGYAPFLMKDHFNEEMDITIGIAFISGGTLGATWSGVENQYQKLTEDTAYTYWKYVNNAKSWFSSSAKPSEMFADEDWDVITFQQGSNNAPDYTTYQPYLNDCINLVSKKVSKSVKIAWLTPHADANVYGQGKEINVLEAAKKVMDETVTEVVIPYGTAIANARRTTLNNVGDAGSLLYEGKHLQNGIPMLVSNYCSMIVILNLLGLNQKSIVGINSIEVNDNWVSTHNIPNASAVGNCVGVTSENCRIAEKCAIMAVKKPYQVTDVSALGIV